MIELEIDESFLNKKRIECMNICFWTPIYEKMEEYLIKNQSLQRLSELYPFIFVASGGAEKYIKEFYGSKAISLPIEQNNMIHKADKAFKEFDQRFEEGVLIKIDMDAILFNVKGLLELVIPLVGRKALIGNEARRKNKKRNYIRGGCQAYTKPLLKEICLDLTYPKISKLDQEIANACRRVQDCEFVYLNLFEDHEIFYTKSAPVWHPSKEKAHMLDCFSQFERTMTQWEKEKNFEL